MVGGLPVDSGESPWTVGIYDKTKQDEQVCAGSIITPYVILTGIYYKLFLNIFKSQ